MTGNLRILLLFAAVITAVWIMHKIRKLKVKMEDAIFWVVFAFVLAVLGLFPELSFWMTKKLGVQSPANLVFLLMIALLMEKVFTLSILVSQLEDKVSVLSAEIALRSHSAERRLGVQGEKQEGEAEAKETAEAGPEAGVRAEKK